MKQGISNEKVIKDSSQLPRNKSLKIFHQNSRGLGNKANELYCQLSVKNSGVLNSNLAVLPELSKSTNNLVFKTDINHKQSAMYQEVII
jgi:hypothetical protein